MKKNSLLFFGMIFLQLSRNILAMEALSPEAIPYLNYEMARGYFALQNHKHSFPVALYMSHHEQEWCMVSDKIDLLLQSNMLYFIDGDLEKNFTQKNSGKGGYSNLEEILAATLLLRGVIFSESGLREERPEFLENPCEEEEQSSTIATMDPISSFHQSQQIHPGISTEVQPEGSYEGKSIIQVPSTGSLRISPDVGGIEPSGEKKVSFEVVEEKEPSSREKKIRTPEEENKRHFRKLEKHSKKFFDEIDIELDALSEEERQDPFKTSAIYAKFYPKIRNCFEQALSDFKEKLELQTYSSAINLATIADRLFKVSLKILPARDYIRPSLGGIENAIANVDLHGILVEQEDFVRNFNAILMALDPKLPPEKIGATLHQGQVIRAITKSAAVSTKAIATGLIVYQCKENKITSSELLKEWQEREKKANLASDQEREKRERIESALPLTDPEEARKAAFLEIIRCGEETLLLIDKIIEIQKHRLLPTHNELLK